MPIMLEWDGYTISPEEFLDSLAVSAEAGWWNGIGKLLETPTAKRYLASSDEGLRKQVLEWQTKCRDALAYEAEHGVGSLINHEHRLNIMRRRVEAAASSKVGSREMAAVD